MEALESMLSITDSLLAPARHRVKKALAAFYANKSFFMGRESSIWARYEEYV